MAGTLLSVGVVLCTSTLAVGFVAAGGAAVVSQRLAGAADAAALAAADAAAGAVVGTPCDLDGMVATVAVSGSFGPVAATVGARAGPPERQ